VSGSGRISLDNTLEERLRLLEDKVSLSLIDKYLSALVEGEKNVDASGNSV